MELYYSSNILTYMFKLFCAKPLDIFNQDNVAIISELEAKHSVMKGNFGKVMQILINLVTNAKDAIESSHLKNGKIIIKTLNESSYIILKIIDNGTGISKTNLTKIFDTFFTTKEVGKGTGIGLSITHTIATEMGGQLNVESEEGKGSVFTIKFPFCDDVKFLPTATEKTQVEHSPLKGRILIAEDEQFLREMLKEIMTSFGLDVQIVSNGLAAFEELKTNHYDVLITDLQMPKMNGEELVKKIIAEKGLDIKIIVVTGGVDTEYSQEGLNFRSMVEAYLNKPFDMNQIYNTLAKLLDTSDKVPGTTSGTTSGHHIRGTTSGSPFKEKP